MKTRNIGVKNKPKTFLNSKEETAMGDEDIFNIEEWRRTKAVLGAELESRNLKMQSFDKKNMANFIIYLLHRIDYLEEKNSHLEDKTFECSITKSSEA
jgi:hypothetical protein